MTRNGVVPAAEILVGIPPRYHAEGCKCIDCHGRPVDDGLLHGLLSTYQHHGCRCPQCRAANAARSHHNRRKARAS